MKPHCQLWFLHSSNHPSILPRLLLLFCVHMESCQIFLKLLSGFLSQGGHSLLLNDNTINEKKEFRKGKSVILGCKILTIIMKTTRYKRYINLDYTNVGDSWQLVYSFKVFLLSMYCVMHLSYIYIFCKALSPLIMVNTSTGPHIYGAQYLINQSDWPTILTYDIYRSLRHILQ